MKVPNLSPSGWLAQLRMDLGQRIWSLLLLVAIISGSFVIFFPRQQSHSDLPSASSSKHELYVEPGFAKESLQLQLHQSQQAAAPEPSGFLEELSCGPGHWQQDYADFHRRTVSGQLPPRFLVSVPLRQGLADHLIGAVSQFYLAVLSRRAFQFSNVASTGHHIKLQQAFDAPSINWTRHIDDDPSLTQHLEEDYKQLLDMGLLPETAFACAFRFLFKPNAAVEKAMESQFRRLLKAPPEVLTIALQVRVGDNVLESGDLQARDDVSLQADYLRGFTDCASEIAAARGFPNDKVLWLLATDSQELREAAQQQYGETIVTSSVAPLHVIRCQKSIPTGDASSASDTETNITTALCDNAIVTAAADMLAISQTDFQVPQ
ncbi:hypothetical protein JKP88DRAFT_254960 [Tribonema minus]|uniref:Uncharacterized protein n=1 Tax=Tribonema minus TaxID=303371 RepID=A0A835Z229_9STRA|nr:hypothetical protein JKP88DRAFT_254960 [Tribonema minus]